MGRILVIEDDATIAEVVREVLCNAGHPVRVTDCAAEAHRAIREFRPDAVVLDISLPDGNGLDVCRELRRTNRVPVLFLTARDLLADKARAFRLGGDDYLTTPFVVAELLLRIEALLRRAAVAPPSGTAVTRVGDLEVDLTARVVRRAGERLALTPMETELLMALASTPTTPWPVDKLARRLGLTAESRAVASELIRLKVSRLRRKLEPEPRRPRYLHNHREAGYLLAFNPGGAIRP
jgi:DNA-binding response OmpR family regulator